MWRLIFFSSDWILSLRSTNIKANRLLGATTSWYVTAKQIIHHMITQMLWCWNGGSSAHQKHSFNKRSFINAQTLPSLVWQMSESAQIVRYPLGNPSLCSGRPSVFPRKRWQAWAGGRKHLHLILDWRKWRSRLTLVVEVTLGGPGFLLGVVCVCVCLSTRWSSQHVSGPLQSPGINPAF